MQARAIPACEKSRQCMPSRCMLNNWMLTNVIAFILWQDVLVSLYMRLWSVTTGGYMRASIGTRTHTDVYIFMNINTLLLQLRTHTHVCAGTPANTPHPDAFNSSMRQHILLASTSTRATKHVALKHLFWEENQKKFTRISLYIFMCLFMSVCLYIHTYIYIHIYIYINIYIYIYIYISHLLYLGNSGL